MDVYQWNTRQCPTLSHCCAPTTHHPPTLIMSSEKGVGVSGKEGSSLAGFWEEEGPQWCSAEFCSPEASSVPFHKSLLNPLPHPDTTKHAVCWDLFAKRLQVFSAEKQLLFLLPSSAQESLVGAGLGQEEYKTIFWEVHYRVLEQLSGLKFKHYFLPVWLQSSHFPSLILNILFNKMELLSHLWLLHKAVGKHAIKRGTHKGVISLL